MTRHTHVLAGALLCALVGATALVAAQQAPTPDRGTEILQQLAERTQQLAQCNIDAGTYRSEIGTLQQQYAGFLSGRIQKAIEDGAVSKFRSAFEKANPGKTLDATMKAIDVPAKTKVSGKTP